MNPDTMEHEVCGVGQEEDTDDDEEDAEVDYAAEPEVWLVGQ